uniref:Uncharacterized protein n=1 Tax=Vitis vinifera TaxID=29760 RepID=F6H534_VITVI
MENWYGILVPASLQLRPPRPLVTIHLRDTASATWDG